MRILFVCTGFLTGMNATLAAYPEETKRSIFGYCRNGLSNEEDLVRAEAQGDVPFCHASIDHAIDRPPQLLFTLNDTHFPSQGCASRAGHPIR